MIPARNNCYNSRRRLRPLLSFRSCSSFLPRHPFAQASLGLDARVGSHGRSVGAKFGHRTNNHKHKHKHGATRNNTCNRNFGGNDSNNSYCGNNGHRCYVRAGGCRFDGNSDCHPGLSLPLLFAPKAPKPRTQWQSLQQRFFRSTPSQDQNQNQNQKNRRGGPHREEEPDPLGPLGRRVLTEELLGRTLGGSAGSGYGARLSGLHGLIGPCVAPGPTPKLVWHRACDRFGFDLPQYRTKAVAAPVGGPGLFVATAVTMVEKTASGGGGLSLADRGHGCHPCLYERLGGHDHVGVHPRFDWIEMVSVGIAPSKAKAESLAALDQIVLWEEATGIDLTLPFGAWPGWDGNQRPAQEAPGGRGQEEGADQDDGHRFRYERVRNLLELAGCSRIQYDHEQFLWEAPWAGGASGRGRRRRRASSGAQPQRFWTADAETWFGGRWYFSESEPLKQWRSPTKAAAEQRALVALLDQNEDSPLAEAARSLGPLLDASPSGRVVPLRVRGLSGPLLKALRESVFPGREEASAAEREHASRKRIHKRLLEKQRSGPGNKGMRWEGPPLSGGSGDDNDHDNDQDHDESGGTGSHADRPSGERKHKGVEDPLPQLHSSALDRDLWETERANLEHHAQDNPGAFEELREARNKLPVRAIRADLLDALRSQRVVVVSGGTGSGKSTQCPQYILEDALASGRGSSTRIVVTQPRRMAAVSLCERVSRERFDASETTGKDLRTVGYAVRFRSRPPRSGGGSIEFVTTGVLLRRLMAACGGGLEGISHVVIDEVHERDTNTDFLLVLLRDLLEERPDLRIVLMSATLDARSFADYFSSRNYGERSSSSGDGGGVSSKGGRSSLLDPSSSVPILSIPSQTRHPVDLFYLEDLIGCGARYSPRMNALAKSLLQHKEESLRQELEKLNMQQHGTKMGSGGHANGSSNDEEKEQRANRIAALELALQHNNSSEESSLSFNRSLSKDNKNFDFSATMTSLVSEMALHLCMAETNANRGGSILCFLPGMDEIKNCIAEIDDHCPCPKLRSKISILPLHSKLPYDDQQKIFDPVKPGTIKLILSTNIAESSVTIDDVLAVIDSGLVKEMAFDACSAMNSLQTNQTSKASATQRMGRAGRVAPGTCYRLYSRGDFEAMEERATPEIKRAALESICLQTCSTMETTRGFSNVQDFLARAMDPPDAVSVALAVDRLKKIGGITTVAGSGDGIEREHLTPLGQFLARLPLDPATGKMLVMGVVMKCLGPLLTAASCLSGRSPFYDPPGERKESKKIRQWFSDDSDIMASVRAYDSFWQKVSEDGWKNAREWAYCHYVSVPAMIAIREVRLQLLNELRKAGLVPKGDIITGSSSSRGSSRNQRVSSRGDLSPKATVNEHSSCEMLTSAVWCTAFPENLASRRRLGHFGVIRTKHEDNASLHPSSVLYHRDQPENGMSLPSDWYLYSEKILTSQVYVRGCTVLAPEQILLFGGYDLAQHGNSDNFDDNRRNNDYQHRIRGVLDGWIAVDGGKSDETVNLLLQTRENIEMIFERRIMYPKKRKYRGKDGLESSRAVEDWDRDERNHDDRIIAGVRDMFESLTRNENSRIYEKEVDPPDDFQKSGSMKSMKSTRSAPLSGLARLAALDGL